MDGRRRPYAMGPAEGTQGETAYDQRLSRDTLDEIAYLDGVPRTNAYTKINPLSQENSEHIIHTTDGHAHKKTRTMHTQRTDVARGHTPTRCAPHQHSPLVTLSRHALPIRLSALSRAQRHEARRDATQDVCAPHVEPSLSLGFSTDDGSLLSRFLSLSHGMGPAACEAGPGILSLARRLQGQPSAVAPPRRASPHPRRGQLSAAAICGPRRRLRPFRAFRLS